MKKVKTVFWMIIFVLVGIFVYQNRSFLFNRQDIVFNIVYGNPYKLTLPVGIYFLSVLFIGALISYFFSLSQRFKSKKTIHKLNETIDKEKQKVLDLESKIGSSSMSVTQVGNNSADI